MIENDCQKGGGGVEAKREDRKRKEVRRRVGKRRRK